MLTSTARGGQFAGQERIEGAKSANQYCDARGQHMIIRRTDGNGIAGLGPVTSSLVFSCVASNDPEYQRPNLLDNRNATADTWSTVVNFHAGDAVTIWGVTPDNFNFDFQDNQGATALLVLRCVRLRRAARPLL
jgi:hypothetical protein